MLDSVTTAATALLEGLLHPAVGRDAFDQAGSDVNTDSANAAAGNVTTSAWESMQVDCTHTAHTHTHCTHTGPCACSALRCAYVTHSLQSFLPQFGAHATGGC